MKREIELMTGYLNSTQTNLLSILDRHDEIVSKLIDLPVHESTRLYFIGNGSSGEGARIASFLSVSVLGVLPLCVTPYSFTHGLVDAVRPDDIVVAISQTGTSHEVVESLRIAKGKSARTISLTATAGSPVAKEAEFPFVFPECVEHVGYKVTGVIGLLYAFWIVILGLAYHNVRITKTELYKNIEEIRSLTLRYDELASIATDWVEKNVDVFEKAKTISVLGTADLVETAMEFAIKSIEVQGRFSLAVETEEFLHGICATDPKDNLVILLVDGKSEAFVRRVYPVIRERGHDVLWIGQGAPREGLALEIVDSKQYTTAQFFPVVHASIIAWARLKGYGDIGTVVFADYQKQLKVREE